MISLILLAGGTGSRMGAVHPKQFLLLGGQPVALHSFNLFMEIPEIGEIIVVCDPAYQNIFHSSSKPLFFAPPGKRRQDSVYNGLQQCSPHAELIVVHDSARPFLEKKDLLNLLEAASRVGAATLATPITSTIKQGNAEKRVEKTVDRSQLWEIQTPQAIRADWIREGFQRVHQKNLQVTDDVSIV